MSFHVLKDELIHHNSEITVAQIDPIHPEADCEKNHHNLKRSLSCEVTDDEEPSKHLKQLKHLHSKEHHHSHSHHHPRELHRSNSHHSNSQRSHSRELHRSNSHHSNSQRSHSREIHRSNSLNSSSPHSQSLVLEYNADFAEADSTLSLPERSHSFNNEDQFSCSDSEPDEIEPRPLLKRTSLSFVQAVSNELQHLSEEVQHIKEDIGTEPEHGFQREEEQEVLRLQNEAMHRAEFKCLIHIMVNFMGFLFVDRETFKVYYREHIWTCLFGTSSYVSNCLPQSERNSGGNDDHCNINNECIDLDSGSIISTWDKVQCHVCFDFSKYVLLIFLVLFLGFAIWATETWFPTTKKFKKMCKNIFDECAHGKDVLEEAALHSSVLLLYDQINMRIPRHVTPPTHDEVAQLLEIFDDNHDGVMDQGEFVDFSEFLFYQVVNDVGLVLTIDLLLSPLYATLMNKVITLISGIHIPTVILVPLVIRKLRSSILKPHEERKKN